MTLPKVIVAATDFSPCGERAQSAAVELAKSLCARLVLVHAWQVPLSVVEVPWLLLEDACAQLEAAERNKLHEALERVRVELPDAEEHFRVAEPRAGILAAANELHADVIVLGTHGRTGLRRLLVGSVAEYIVHHAHCSTWLVRSSEASHG